MHVQPIAPGLFCVSAPQRFYGLPLGTRMTVLVLDAGVLVHSPVAIDPSAIAPLGPLRFAVAPNLLHHLHVGPWLTAGAEGWAAPGLATKRPDLQFAGTLKTGMDTFGPDVEVYALTSFPFSNEVVLLHRPSRTLITTDLVFHLQPNAPWQTRVAFFCAGGYPGCRSTILEMALMRRDAARADLHHILEMDFDRLIMAHGAIIESGGKDALRRAFRWLKLPRALL